MGILYNSVKKANLHLEMKRKFILEKLTNLGVKHSQQGIPIQELDYEDLKYEYVLASFRQIDVEKDENRWF